MLYVVSTPIGNREDITLRALRILAEVALIVAEDTRHSGRLLQYYQIRKPLLSLHEHNEMDRIPELLARLELGEDVALISDAGTPTVSDPGYRLIAAALEAGYTVSPIPGASAILAALVAAGLPTDRFLFLGFPPRKANARKKLLEEVVLEPGTLIFYESARRLQGLLVAIAKELGADRPVVVARELTKLHESLVRGTAGELLALFESAPRGEVVLLVGGAITADRSQIPAAVAEIMKDMLEGGRSVSDAARLLAQVTGLPRRELYQLGLELRDKSRSRV
ncbi:MAG: 16S rRNA (cytidine(1402)-2'-O)-methyltransferase [Chloroflexi bacterium]|nr:16S rRNA (cytidine(1402)-2'-O)-methyltransferase [Chloroflexota bacterium]